MSENHGPSFSGEFQEPFAAIRQCLLDSGMFPKGLTGACFSGAFLSDFILKEKGFESEIVSNYRHCFSRFFVEGVPYVLDLTATQISKKRYDEVSILTEREAKSRLMPMKRNFYDTLMAFRDSRALLMPNPDEELLVARALVNNLSGIIGKPSRYDEYNAIQSLSELNRFVDTLILESRQLINDKVMPLEKKKPLSSRKRRQDTGFGMGF